MLALVVLPMVVLIFAGLVRRIQIARTSRELRRMGFVGSVPYGRETSPIWRPVGAGLVALGALIIAMFVLPGPLSGRMLTSTGGSPLPVPPTHAPVVPPGTSHVSAHAPSEQPPTPTQSGSPQASTAPSVSPATDGGGDAGAPSAVSALPASATAIQLQWAPVSGTATYHVERSTDTVDWDTVFSTSGGQTRYTDAALSSGTTYYYRVAAVDGEDVSRSDVVSATTTVDTPAAPVLTSATGSAASVVLGWSDVDGELAYRIERSPDGTSGWTGIGTTGQGVTLYSDTGLASATTYYYRVVAVSRDGSSPPSSVLSATTDLAGSSTSGSNAAPSVAPTAP